VTVDQWMARFDAALSVAPARRRALCEELAGHLADAVAAGESEAAATVSLGAPERVAAACSREADLVAVARAVWILLGGVVVLGLFWRLGVLLYPRGQWTTPPVAMIAPHHVGLAAWAGAGVAGAAALLALRSWRLSGRHRRLALAAAALLVGALALHLVAGNVFVWVRNGIVAGSPSDGAQAAITAAHTLVAVAAVAPLVRAVRRLR
jgi:hypothetical protein